MAAGRMGSGSLGVFMSRPAIAVFFDAENINPRLALPTLQRLGQGGIIKTKRAVGDFSGSLLSGWIAAAAANGIELVMQQGLGRGKNSADIAMTIEAMEVALSGNVETIALVSNDGDFAPLALRLRRYGLTVLGLGGVKASTAFRAACTSFENIADAAPPPIQAKPPSPVRTPLTPAELRSAQKIAEAACREAGGVLIPAHLCRAIVLADQKLATRLSGNGRFLKTLVDNGIVERVGSGAELKVRMASLRVAS